MVRFIIELISVIWGMFNCIREIVIRLPFDGIWKYKVYYIIQSRANILLLFISLGITICICTSLRTKPKLIQIISLIFNILYIVLCMNTLFNM